MAVKEFASPATFARHLLALSAEGGEVVRHIGEVSGQLIERDAKERIGHYQGALGQFPAWAPLAESTEAEKAAAGYPQNAPLLRTGEMRESISHTVETAFNPWPEAKVIVGSTQEKMVYHEFGTSRMPPRPVLGPALFNNKDKLDALAAVTVASWIGGLGWRRPRLKAADEVAL